jgi:hypothetical protein
MQVTSNNAQVHISAQSRSLQINVLDPLCHVMPRIQKNKSELESSMKKRTHKSKFRLRKNWKS